MNQPTASEAFEAYAEEFTALLGQIITASSRPGDAETMKHQNKARIDQCHDLLQQMALEARSLEDAHADEKSALLDRHRIYKSQWQAAKLQAEKESLFIFSSDGTAAQNRQQQQQLAAAEATLERQNATLERASRTLQETEDVATEIATHLHENRETLERTRANTKEVGTLAARGHQIATNLLRPWWRKGWS